MPKGVYERKSAQQRFYEKVDMRSDTECWNWLASKCSDGYGEWSFIDESGQKRQTSASRYALMMKLNNYHLDASVKARHTCDNRACVNPNHIIEGSAADNSADMIERNRQARGELCAAAKMTEEQARDCIKNYRADKQSGRLYGSLERLAVKHNLSKQLVYRCVSGKSWRHLQDIQM